MLNKQLVWCIAVLLSAAGANALHGQGLLWNFLGDTQIDGIQNHNKIQVSGQHGPFRAVQLRVSGDGIFFERLVIRFSNGTSEEFPIGHRILPGAHMIDLAGEPRTLESVELWYFRESWEHLPRVTLYGTVNDLDIANRESPTYGL